MSQAPPDPHHAHRAPDEIAGMFDRIAGRYDLLNRVLSAGRDRTWRARAVETLQLQGGETVLDLCTGTADLLLALAPPGGAAARVVGVDFSTEMLRLGYRKVRRSTARGALTLLRGDAERIPLGDRSVDGVTIGFGIRNVQDRVAALAEVRRVLRPGGRLAILEFGTPGPAPLRAVYLWYFQRLLPADRPARLPPRERLQLSAGVGRRISGARRFLRDVGAGRLCRRALRTADARHRLPLHRPRRLRSGPHCYNRETS